MAILAERNWTGIGAYLGIALAVLALIVLAIGPLGWRLGWWHFRFAFFWLMPAAAYAGLAAAAILALAFGWSHLGGRGLGLAAVGIVLGAIVAYLPWQYDRLRGVLPPI